jgi:hypothetical protein
MSSKLSKNQLTTCASSSHLQTGFDAVIVCSMNQTNVTDVEAKTFFSILQRAV